MLRKYLHRKTRAETWAEQYDPFNKEQLVQYQIHQHFFPETATPSGTVIKPLLISSMVLFHGKRVLIEPGDYLFEIESGRYNALPPVNFSQAFEVES